MKVFLKNTFSEIKNILAEKMLSFLFVFPLVFSFAFFLLLGVFLSNPKKKSKNAIPKNIVPKKVLYFFCIYLSWALLGSLPAFLGFAAKDHIFCSDSFYKRSGMEGLSNRLSSCLSPGLSAQSLWKGKNPYEPSVELPAGSILKLEVDEPILIEYEYEDLRDRTKTLKLVPDKNLTKELPPVNTNHSIVNKNKSRLKSKSRIKFQIAVTVQETSNKNVIEFRGLKLIAQEGGKQRQQVQVTGRVQRSDIASGRLIHSSDVANLVIQITGAPVRVQEKFPMKYDENGNPSAKLSDAEKQRLLLDYLNRVLGESKP